MLTKANFFLLCFALLFMTMELNFHFQSVTKACKIYFWMYNIHTYIEKESLLCMAVWRDRIVHVGFSKKSRGKLIYWLESWENEQERMERSSNAEIRRKNSSNFPKKKRNKRTEKHQISIPFRRFFFSHFICACAFVHHFIFTFISVGCCCLLRSCWNGCQTT